MTVKEFYDSIGGDYDTVFSQLLKDERIAKFAKRFAEDPTYSQLIASLNNKDYDTAFRMAHTLKGVAANLAFKEFGKASSDLTEILRAKDIASVEQALAKVTTEYEKLISAIQNID